MDTQFVAGPGLVRWHTAAADPRVRPGPGKVESAGHLPLCRRLRCHGSSPARNDTRVRLSGFVRTLQMAFHFCAAISARNLYRFLLVGPEGNSLGGFLLGRLAWLDADLRVLPHLRR